MDDEILTQHVTENRVGKTANREIMWCKMYATHETDTSQKVNRFLQ